jgi:hypothetical protein
MVLWGEHRRHHNSKTTAHRGYGPETKSALGVAAMAPRTQPSMSEKITKKLSP